MENVAISARKKITMDKYFSQVKIVTPNNIATLLDTQVRAVVSSVEEVNNFLLVSGKIMANVVYVTDENKVENTEMTVDFVEKQKINYLFSEICAEDKLEVQNINFSQSEVIISVCHKTELTGIYRYLVGDATKVDDEFVLNKKNMVVSSFKQSNDENFVVAEEVETNLNNIKILNINSEVVLNSVVSAVEKVVIDGKVKVNALYLDENGLGEISRDFEFKQELAMNSALPGMNVDVVLRHLNTSIVEEQKDDKTSLAFVIDLSVKAYLFEELTVETFDDIFSLKNEISPVYEIAEFSCGDGCEFDTDTVLLQTDVSVNGDFDDIVGVYSPRVNVLDVQDLGEKLVVISEIQAIAVYKTQTSLAKINLSCETRFETEKDLNKNFKTAQAVASVSAFKVKAGKDLESAFSLEYKFEFEKETSENFVKDYEVLRKKADTDAGVKVYVTRGHQTVFDVAKVLNVKPELIKNQMEIDDCFEAGQKIFVYCPINS